MLSLIYWSHVMLGVPVLAVLSNVLLWAAGGWLPVELGDEPLDCPSLTVAGIPVEEIFAEGELGQVLRLNP